MRYRVIIILSTIYYLLVFPIHYVDSAKSDEFIDYLSKKIYEDCWGNDIDIRKFSPLNILPVKTATSTIYKYVEEMPSLTWPYVLEKIKGLLSHVVAMEPYAEYMELGDTVQEVGVSSHYDFYEGGEKLIGISSEGYHLFNCGDKFLDVNGETYIWDGKVVEPPKYSIKFSIFEIGGISILGIGFSVFVVNLIIKKRKKRKIKRL